MPEPVETLEGWFALHDFRRIDWTVWRQWSSDQQQVARHALLELTRQWLAVPADEGSSAVYRMIGHKSDLLWLHFRSHPSMLMACETGLDASPAGPLLSRPYSYFSVVELSKYLAQGQSTQSMSTWLRQRLQPAIPAKDYVCFYPMNKKREGADNWYMLAHQQRRELMKSHGQIGHKYHEEVIQIVTGSQGLDDWEWGVTLFSDDAVQFKKLVYEMRFDEASARYAEFGPFYVGRRITMEELTALLT
jgi:peroxiredoxin